MRIVQICPYSWDAPGGVQAHVRQLSRHLARRGHEVLVLTPGDEPATDDHVQIVGRPVRVPFNGSVVPLCFSAASGAQVRSALDRFAPDIVHVHEPLAPSTSMLGTFSAKAPVVATFHAYYGHESLHAHMYSAVAPLLRPIWRRLACRIAVSQAAASCVGSRMGTDRLRVIPNGIDIDHFERAGPADLPPGRKLLFVGRLERRKGLPVALRAFADLATKLPDLTMLVIGEGPDREAVDELPDDLRGRVSMLGYLHGEALPTYHAAADVFIASATGQESFGIVLIEAMAAGLPVVASDIPGYREVVRAGVEGLLVPPGDPGALSESLLTILQNPALAMRFASAGRKRARVFSWESVIGKLEAAYDEALRTPRFRRSIARENGDGRRVGATHRAKSAAAP